MAHNNSDTILRGNMTSKEALFKDKLRKIYGGAYADIVNVSIRTSDQEQKYPVI